MPNVTIYLPEEVEKAVRRVARKENLTVSRWVAALISREMQGRPAQGVVNAAGSIPDFPSLEEIRAGYAPDAERESME